MRPGNHRSEAHKTGMVSRSLRRSIVNPFDRWYHAVTFDSANAMLATFKRERDQTLAHRRQ